MADENRLDSELQEQEQLLASVLSAGDADALDQVLAVDYLFTSAQGETWGRDRAIADVRAAAFRVRYIAVDVDRVMAWGNVGVVVGQSEVQGQIGAQQLSGGFRFTHVWRRGDGGWQLVAGHTSQAAEEVELEGHSHKAAQRRVAPTRADGPTCRRGSTRSLDGCIVLLGLCRKEGAACVFRV